MAKTRSALRLLTILHPDGTLTRREYEKSQQLDVFQQAVGGYIELIGGFTRFEGRARTAYCNEEGKLDGLKVNLYATALWGGCLQRVPGDVLVGPVAIDQTIGKE
jgi:hypothetical protein